MPSAARERIVLLRRHPEPDRPAVGLPLPHPLPEGPGACCAAEEPELIDRGFGHPVACHYPERMPETMTVTPVDLTEGSVH